MRFDFKIITDEHIDALEELEKTCFDDPWSKEMLLGDVTNESTLYVGAFDDDRLVGYAGMWLSIGETQITNVAVHPFCRRMGIASAIINYFVDFCTENGFEGITLEVRESNKSAISLYNSLGFEVVGMRKNYYKNPTENAILMTKELGRND